jgi:multiple sugar transport system ATP-binding protein
VTHDQVEAMTMGHRVAVLSGGQLQQVDTPRTLYDNPVNQFVAGFIGSPAMNLQTVPLTEGGARLAGPHRQRRRLLHDALRVDEACAAGVARSPPPCSRTVPIPRTRPGHR